MIEPELFRPHWTSPPGETISDFLEEQDLSLTEFARRIDFTREEVRALLSGTTMITVDLARKLSATLGATPAFWIVRDHQYREDQKHQELWSSTSIKGWLRDIPVRDMITFGWLGITSKAPTVIKAEACLQFFGVESIEEWQEKYASILSATAFRTSSTFSTSPGATAAWMRRGEIIGRSIRCQEWNGKRFRAALTNVRDLTRSKKPHLFVPELQKICAECGVAVVILPAPAGCRASGATRFLTKDKALLLLSFRYKSDDHFWFSFFHEAGHLLLHDMTKVFVEIPALSADDNSEREANDFAVEVLIPNQHLHNMLDLPVDGRVIMKFAKSIGLSPGIVVGQLQYHGRLTRRQLNNLKRKFEWEK